MVSHCSAFRVFFSCRDFGSKIHFGVIYARIQDHGQILESYLGGKYRGNWNYDIWKLGAIGTMIWESRGNWNHDIWEIIFWEIEV